MELRKPVALRELFRYAKTDIGAFSALYVYISAEDSETALRPDMTCWLDAPPSEGCGGEDLFPPFIQENRLEVLCSGDNLADVITAALQQKPSVTAAQLTDALDYFLCTDGFLELTAKRGKWLELVLLPNTQKTQVLESIAAFGAARLRTYSLLEADGATVLYSQDKKSELVPFADWADRSFRCALVVSLSPDFWSHMLYWNGLCSPKYLPKPGQERKQNPKTELCANLEAFRQAFPNSDAETLEKYLFQARYRGLDRSAPRIVQFYTENGMSEHLLSRDGALFVRP